MHIILRDSKLNMSSCPFKERQLKLNDMLIAQIFVFTLIPYDSQQKNLYLWIKANCDWSNNLTWKECSLILITI